MDLFFNDFNNLMPLMPSENKGKVKKQKKQTILITLITFNNFCEQKIKQKSRSKRNGWIVGVNGKNPLCISFTGRFTAGPARRRLCPNVK
jgi:hypothetical protein